MYICAIILILASFFLGAVPFGLCLARVIGGIDLRKAGSGNIGATNVARTLGLGFGILTLVFDMGKGLACIAAAEYFFGQSEGLRDWIPAGAGLAAFLGHVYSPFLKFKGGKGVATALGVYVYLAPLAVLPTLFLFLAVVAKWGFVSVGSLTAASMVPPLAYILGYPPQVWGLALVMAFFIILRHSENLSRLIRGQENKWRRDHGASGKLRSNQKAD